MRNSVFQNQIEKKNNSIDKQYICQNQFENFRIKIEDINFQQCHSFNYKQTANQVQQQDLGSDNSGQSQSLDQKYLKKEQERSKKIRVFQKLKDLLFQIKLRFIAQKMLSKTSSFMYKNLISKQFKMIDDKAYFNTNRRIGEQQDLILREESKLKSFWFKKISIMKMRQVNIWKQIKDYLRIKFLKNVILRAVSIVDKNMTLMDSTSFAKICFDIISLLLFTSYVLQIPLQLIFTENDNHSFVYSFPCFILFDILFAINTTIYDKGKQIKKRNQTYSLNFYSLFLPNMIIITSYLIHIGLYLHIRNSVYFNILLLTIFLRFSMISQIINKFEEMMNLTKKQKYILELFTLVFKIILIAHSISCIWLLVAKYQLKNSSQNTWMKDYSFTNTSYTYLYINAYYFTIVTMITVGYGDFIQTSYLEKVIAIFTMIFTCCIFAYSMNTIGLIIKNFNESELVIKRNIHIINSYMHKKNINQKTQGAIRQYLQYYWKEESNRDSKSEEKIINQLSENLKQILYLESNNIIFKKYSIFRNHFSGDFKQKIIPLIKEHRATPDELICTENNEDDCSIYFLKKGSVEIILQASSSSSNNQNKQNIVLSVGQSFGEISFFTGKPRCMSIKSLEFTTLLYIKRIDFLQTIKCFPEDYERFCYIKDNIDLYSNRSQLNIQYLSCRQLGHIVKDCPYIHFVHNQNKTRYQFVFSSFQERTKQKRKLNQKYQTILNNQIIKASAITLQTNYEIEEAYSSQSQSDYQSNEMHSPQSSTERKIKFQLEFDKLNDNISFIESPLKYLPKNSEINNTKTKSFSQFEDQKDMKIIEENLKSPNQQNQKLYLKQTTKDNLDLLNSQQEQYKEFGHSDIWLEIQDDDNKLNYVQNFNKGIVLNKDYILGTSKHSKKLQEQQYEKKFSNIQANQAQSNDKKQQDLLKVINNHLTKNTWSEFLFQDGFDIDKNFLYYFPRNNIQNLINSMQKKQQKKQQFIRKSLDISESNCKKSSIIFRKKKDNTDSTKQNPLMQEDKEKKRSIFWENLFNFSGDLKSIKCFENCELFQANQSINQAFKESNKLQNQSIIHTEQQISLDESQLKQWSFSQNYQELNNQKIQINQSLIDLKIKILTRKEINLINILAKRIRSLQIDTNKISDIIKIKNLVDQDFQQAFTKYFTDSKMCNQENDNEYQQQGLITHIFQSNKFDLIKKSNIIDDT
ncbi:hypothetical protein ABPG72_010375 [Tetrahymena utriculariae]